MFCAFDLYFRGFERMPLKKVWQALGAALGRDKILKVSFVRNLLRVTVWKEFREEVARALESTSSPL